MADCVFCKGKIPENMYDKWHPNLLHCSRRCIKNAWAMRNKAPKRSTVLNGPGFTDCTAKGLYWEIHAAKLLGGRVLSLERMNREADLELPGGEKIDVKSCNLYRRRGGAPGWWVFNRNTEKPIDFFFCIGLEDNKPVKYFKIPTNRFPTSGATISPTSKKYREFEFRL